MTFLTTRFTNETLAENVRYRETNNIPCIYNLSVPISDQHSYKDLYILEMNNSENQLIGIGIINKKIWPRERVYSDPCYNRYTYKGTTYIYRDKIPPEILEDLEQKLFRGRGHLKRGKGMTKFPDKWLKKEYYDFINSLNRIE
jgi:hypothetical protein